MRIQQERIAVWRSVALRKDLDRRASLVKMEPNGLDPAYNAALVVRAIEVIDQSSDGQRRFAAH